MTESIWLTFKLMRSSQFFKVVVLDILVGLGFMVLEEVLGLPVEVLLRKIFGFLKKFQGF